MGWWSKARLYLKMHCSRGRIRLGSGLVVHGRVLIQGKGCVRIGAGVHLDAHQAPIVLTAFQNAEITIGEGVLIESGVCIEARSAVKIGSHAKIRAFAMLLDNHFHQLEGDRDIAPESFPVLVEDEADIGPRAILLPGAQVGGGTRIGPCAVLSRRTPPGLVLQGNPAVVCKPL